MITTSQTKDISSGMIKIRDYDKKFHRDQAVKYNPPNLYGIANSGLVNPIQNRINKFRNSSNISGFGSKSSRGIEFARDTNEDRHSTIDDMLSQASELRSRMNLPPPKNKNTGLFMQEITDESRSKIY